MQTIEAVIDENGKVHLLEPVKLKTVHRVFITILPNQSEADGETAVDVTKLGKIIDEDLETARREISESFLKSIENSAGNLEQR